MTRWALVILLLVAPARADDLDELRQLRQELHAVQGVAIRLGGVDQIAATKAIVEVIIKLNERLERLEKERR